MEIRNSKLIAPLFIFLFILIIVFILSTLDKKEEEPKAVVETPDEAAVLPTEYSRVSFFLGQPVRASLAIPAHWEGKYRFKHSARSASFYYIGAPGEELLLFNLVLYEPANKKNNTLKTIREKDGFVVAYSISTDNIAKASNQEEFGAMANEAGEIIKSIILK